MKTKIFNAVCKTRYLALLVVLIFTCGNVWGANTELTFTLTSNPGSKWPTSSKAGNYTYTIGGNTYTFALGANVYCNSGYLMLKYTTSLGLPAISGKKLTKVVVSNSSGCSTSTKVGISSSSSSASYISGGAIQTYSKTSSTYTYDLTETSDNTMYYLYVTNKNCQITELKLTYSGGSTPTVTPDPTNLSWGTVLQGSSQSTKTITITGSNLTAGTLTISATGGYSVTPTSKSVSGTLSATTLTVTPPNTATTGTKNGKVTISGGGLASSVEVNLSMTVNAGSTVTWMNNGSVYTTTLVENGSKPTFPDAPSSCDGTSTAFYGWATDTWTEKLNDVSSKTIYLSGDAMPAVSGAVTYYAVFAKESATAFERITSADDIYIGQKIAIVSNKQDYILQSDFAGTTAATHPNSDDNKLTVTSSQVWTITDIDEYGYYKLKNSTTQMGVNRTSGLTSGSVAVGNYSTEASWWAINETTDFTYTVDDCFYMYNWATNTYYNFLENSGSFWLSYYAANITSGNKVWYAMKLYQPERSEYLTTCCAHTMALTAGATDATTHCTSLIFSNDNLPTCSDEPTDRQVTITVTPYDGYAAPAELTPSGDGTATYVSGPAGSGPYTYVYEFKKDDNGAGTFTATCTPKAISLVLDKNNSDVSGSANGSATVYFDAISLSTISHATRSGHVLDGYYAEPGCTNKVLTDAGALVNHTGYVVSDKWARATTPTTLYAKWIAKSFDDYVFSCAELTLTAHPETAGAPIFITSVADKKVRSQGYIQITGSGLTPNQTLTFPSLPATFEIKTATYDALSTDASGAIDVAAYIFYTPDADATTDGLDKITGITVSVGGAKPKQVSLTQDIIGRHLPTAGYVIAGKKDNKWYALPSNMESTTNPKPSEIAVDDLNNPSIAYTAASNIYGLEGPTTSGAGNNISSGNGQYIRLTMSINDGTLDPHAAPLFGNSTGNNDIGKSGKAQASSPLSAGWWWLLTQKNTSITNPKDAKYTIKCANNTSTLNLRDNAGNPDWGLFASGVGELRLIPASDIPYTEAYFVEWGQHGGVVEVDATGIEATSVVARLGEATSSAITLSQTGTSVKGSATKYNYTVNFGEGIDFAAAASNGAMLTLEWYNNSDVLVAVSNIIVPKIVAASATMSSLIATDDPWNSADVHVLPGVTLTANAGDFSNKDVVVDRLEIYPGATVKVTKGAQDVGTLKVRTLVLRNGWTRVGEKIYDVARLYVYTDANLAKNANDNVWYSDWYIDYDQYYPMAVPFPVATNSITYKNTKSKATAGVIIRYYDGARRAEHEQQDQDDNWVAYTWGDGGTMPENLAPSTGYAMTAKRPSGKAFSIVRMPMAFTNPWTALGEHGYVDETHKDQVSVTGWGKGTAEWYAMGWNFVANPYMCTFNGNDDGISGKITTQEGGDIKYATIPDLDFQNYYQVPIAEANLKPASAFFIQADNAEPQTITFNAGKIVPPSAPARYMTKNEAIPEQEAYIRLSHGEEKDLMGLIIGEDYTATYEPNADLAKIQGGGNTVKTYMRYSDMDMAYVAINATLAKEWIPVTVNLPADGEYTFSLTNSSTVDALDGVYLIDYKNENTITNLIDNDYVFTAEAGTISDRFAINAIYGERETPTGLDAIEIGTIDPDKPIKFLYHEKVYILYQGIIYDATGKRVSIIKR